ncbi:hypothetical protein EPJ70_08050 [Brachyspira aalborgi]|uniref:Uncharacterized protein n=1 Tax=Brachyspira aalborgi TaxID=29522 RepID=A0A5C8F3B5_9SPIR|nr:hypothetical protein [Brachyspira aalborgi]TXJ44178.1 hypothetical protein EPJ70_08050 [Brachyspira aalborgi]
MKTIFRFIYDKKDEGIYRKRTIFGIKIITKPIELRLNIIEEKINSINNIISNNNSDDMLIKLRVYEKYSKHSN